jgi:hypothetical protein
MLNGRFVAPGNLVDGDAENGGDFLALGGAGCPASQRDGGDAAFVEAALRGEFGDAEVSVAAKVGDGVDHEERIAWSERAKNCLSGKVPMGCGVDAIARIVQHRPIVGRRSKIV